MAPPARAALAPEQLHALFDVLTHHETYAEIEEFKFPGAVTSYGFPFAPRTVEPELPGAAATAATAAASSSPSPSSFGAGLSGWRSWSSTPANSLPCTPRSRTPVPAAASTKDGGGCAGADGQGGEAGAEAEAAAQGPSEAPLLQSMLTRFLLPLPGVRELPREFWSVRVQALLARLGEAELSESYDKGAMGTRKVLATGASGILEMLARGAFGGVKRRRQHGSGDGDGQQQSDTDAWKGEGKEGDASYDRFKAEDLARAWDDIVEGFVYGTLVDEAFDHFSKTDDLEALAPSVQASAEYAIVHVATFMHHIFVLSPEGQYLLKLLENIHNLIPYKMVKQTLRIGNAATMINGMMRLLLAKLSVTSITNWVGLTASADDGMNLLQRIISLVLSWDAGEFRKGLDKIEKSKDPDRPSDEMLQALRQHVSQDRGEHETVRAASAEHAQSIITAIFKAADAQAEGDIDAGLADELTEARHAQCLEYYSALLSVRDRESITTALCRQPPDLFTAMVKDVFAAYEPILRAVHSHVDLRTHVEAGQAFIDDFIRTSKPKKTTAEMPSVDDYVDLLMRNRHVMYRWVNSLAAGCPEIWEEVRKWAKESFAYFRQEETAPAQSEEDSSKDGPDAEKEEKNANESTAASEAPAQSVMDQRLLELFQSLPPDSQQPILAALDAHSEYLNKLSQKSHSELQRILDAQDTGSGSMAGPGVFLSRWQSLLFETPITPGTPRGPVRHGRDVKYAMAMGKTSATDADKAREVALQAVEEGPEAPDVSIVVKELGPGFRTLLQEVGGK